MATAAFIAPTGALAPTFVPYRTQVGDRWDLLAWRFYGDPTLYLPIVLNNPQLQIDGVFAAGVLVAIPIITQSSAPLTSDVPPWKQGDAN